EESPGFLLLADVIPGVRIEGGDRRRRADQADHVLAALGADLELLDGARRRGEAALVDDRLAGGEKGHEGANEEERGGATHGRFLQSDRERAPNMSWCRSGVNRPMPRTSCLEEPSCFAAAARPLRNSPPPSMCAPPSGRARPSCSRPAAFPTRWTAGSMRSPCTRR